MPSHPRPYPSRFAEVATRCVPRLLLACAATLLVGSVCHAQVLYQEDFEKRAAGAKVACAHDRSGWAGGSADLSIVDTGTEAGNVLQAEVHGYGQIEMNPFHIEEGGNYRVTATVSARGIQTVEFAVRQAPGPYRKHGKLSTQVFESPSKLEFYIRDTKPNNPVHVQFVMKGITTLMIDDIKVEKVDDLPPLSSNPADMLMLDPDWPEGNLLANSGFEVGQDGWHFRGSLSVIETKDAYEGRNVLRLEKGQAVTTFVKLPLRRETLAVCRVKAIGSRAKVTLRFGDYVAMGSGSDGKSQEWDIKPEDGWIPLRMSWQPGIPEGQILPWKPFYLSIDSTSEVLVDAVELRHLGVGMPPPEQAYAPRSDAEFAVDVDAPYHVATVGEAVTVTLRSSKPITDATLHCFDESNQLVRKWSLSTQNHQATVVVDLQPGAWRLTTSRTGDASYAGLKPPDVIHGECMLLIVPPMPDVPLDVWHFGSHIRPDEDMLKATWKLGWRWTRMHDAAAYAKWPMFERTQGEYSLDEKTRVLKETAGHAILGNIDWIPTWAPQKGKATGPRTTYDKIIDETYPLLEKACTELAKQGKGLIDEYEVTNEPNLTGVPAETYHEVLKTVARGLRKGDPDAVVVGLGGACPSETQWFYQGIALGAGEFSDALSFHGYGFVPNGQGRGPQPLIDAVVRMEAAMAKAGAPGKRLYDTESGFIIRTALTKHFNPTGNARPQSVALALPKAIAAVVASGLDRWFYYAAFDQSHPGDGGGYSGAEADNSIKLPFQPMAVAISMVEGREFTGYTTEGSVVSLSFAGRGARMEMKWNYAGTTPFTPPANALGVVSMWGRPIESTDSVTLSEEPVYILLPTDDTP